MNILLLGSGGREHTFAWKLAQSSKCTQLYIAPGNAGTAACGTNISISPEDFEAINKFVVEKDIKMVVVGSEAPLVKGIYDYFKNDDNLKDVMVIGPSKEGAKLEGSKAYSKAFMERYNVPTAAYKEFDTNNIEEGSTYIDAQKTPIVLKADGLAAGKGVLIINDKQEAKDALKEMIEEAKFGEASEKVVIEEFLDGIEFSVFVLTDGDTYTILPTAKDYKRISDGDTGLNTGGMGAISPVPICTDELMQKVETQVVQPMINGLKGEGIVYKGFLYCGLILVDNEPKVIEFNCRMGDPETQVVIPKIESDLLEVFESVANGTLKNYTVNCSEKANCTVVLASGGYPESYEKGKEITGLDNVSDSLVFHAGTKKSDGKTLTNGGRVLTVTSFGDTLQEALGKSYEAVKNINFDKKYYRKDIGNEFV